MYIVTVCDEKKYNRIRVRDPFSDQGEWYVTAEGTRNSGSLAEDQTSVGVYQCDTEGAAVDMAKHCVRAHPHLTATISKMMSLVTASQPTCTVKKISEKGVLPA